MVMFGQLPIASTELILLNTTGQTVVRKVVNSVKELLPIENLPAGIYVLRIQNDAGSETKKNSY